MLLVCSQTFAINWTAATRTDRKSLDVVLQRLEHARALTSDKATQRELTAMEAHLQPMLTRHGGVPGWAQGGRIVPGSDDELDLVCAQHGLAHTSIERGQLSKDLMVTTMRWLRQSIVAIAIGMGPWLPIVALLYIAYRRTLNESAIMHKRVDELFPDRLERAQRFSNPIIHRAHQRLKKLKLL
jgi:hypothetical protein